MIIQGDCLIKLKEIPDNSIDSIVTDPPYELGFMGKSWDNTGIANNPIMWAECLRVLKPGGYLLSFGGTRTYHRMACAIEDAGFEVRDMIEWVYGSGFPKSLNIGKAVDKLQGNEREVVGDKPYTSQDIRGNAYESSEAKERPRLQEKITKGTSEYEGWGTALKPAHEPICMARKPLAEKTVAENCLKYGTGGINIDESRVISYTTAYNDGGNNDCTLQEHTVLEIRHKICSQPPFSLSASLELSRLSSDDEYGQKWYKQRDYSDDCSSCRRLYEALLPLFLKGDQVSVQQLHDVLSDIDQLRKEQKHNLSSQDSDLPSSLDDFYQLILSYLNDTTLILNRQEKITLNLNKKGEQLFNEGDVKKAKWSGDSEERIGRFPANLIHDNSEEVRECFPETKSGGKNGSKYINKTSKENWSVSFGADIGKETGTCISDSGNASRFFKSIIYQAKASKSERNRGCEELEEKQTGSFDGNADTINTNRKIGADPSKPNTPRQNYHPTVKPIALMEYLIKMVTPKGGTVLDPFMGSGSTGVAVKKNGYNFIGIEMEEDYIKIAKARINI